MVSIRPCLTRFFFVTFSCIILTVIGERAVSQVRLEDMAKLDRFVRLRRALNQTVVRNDYPQFKWGKDGQSFTYKVEKKRYLRQLDQEQAILLTGKKDKDDVPQRRAPERGRQFSVVFSPDNKIKAYTKDRNVFIVKTNSNKPTQITTEGNAEKRTKFGVASWVYGEELGVREAMFWSPDSSKLAYYGFDESKVSDYYLTIDQVKQYDKLDIEAYPKAGTPNPIVSLFVYDLKTKTTTKIDTNFDSKAGVDLGHYVYNIQWSPDGSELLYNRTNRKQDIMEMVAASPKTGKCRVVVRDTQKTWTDNSPGLWWVTNEKGEKSSFIWLSYRGNYRNLALVQLDGKGEKPITQHEFDVVSVVRIDEKKKIIYYTARDGDNPYRIQLHKVKLDGTGEKRLTSPKYSHSIQINEACDAIIDTYETTDTPPVTVQLDMDGKQVKVLDEADFSRFDQNQLNRVEMFTYKAADGKTDCYGYLMKPAGFDPNKKYPLIVTVYAGPESGTYSERFQIPSPMTELGFCVASFDGRGTSGRGKAFLDEVYGKLGVVEIDDQAAGVKYLRERPYIDGNRVGVTGTSYGGYATIMCLLRHPDVFQVGIACSSVTAWENYDTIYTERYMNTPQDNPEGYKNGSAMTYAKDLQGKLMLFYGTLDNNVHPTNTYQLVAAFNRAGKVYDMMVAPDHGHVGLNDRLTFNYFCEHLLGKPTIDQMKRAFNRRSTMRRELLAQK